MDSSTVWGWGVICGMMPMGYGMTLAIHVNLRFCCEDFGPLTGFEPKQHPQNKETGHR
jgi:hypothetical protein